MGNFILIGLFGAALLSAGIGSFSGKGPWMLLSPVFAILGFLTGLLLGVSLKTLLLPLLLLTAISLLPLTRKEGGDEL